MVFGVKVQYADSSNFFVIAAESEQEATDTLNELGYADFEVTDFEVMLREQYDDLAMLQSV